MDAALLTDTPTARAVPDPAADHVTFQAQGTSTATIDVFMVYRSSDCHTQADALVTRERPTSEKKTIWRKRLSMPED